MGAHIGQAGVLEVALRVAVVTPLADESCVAGDDFDLRFESSCVPLVASEQSSSGELRFES